MSRSYRFLALALAALLVLVGVAKVLDGGESTDASVTGVPSATEPAGDGTTAAPGGDTVALAEGLVTDEVDGDMETTSTTAPPQTAACSITGPPGAPQAPRSRRATSSPRCRPDAGSCAPPAPRLAPWRRW